MEKFTFEEIVKHCEVLKQVEPEMEKAKKACRDAYDFIEKKIIEMQFSPAELRLMGKEYLIGVKPSDVLK